MAQFHSLKIQSITRQTEKAVSITFEVPELLKTAFDFKAGQYISLKTLIDAQEIRRDYSLSSSPASGDLTITVKEIEDGVFSSYANKDLKAGDVLDVAAPNGRFFYDAQPESTTTVAAFAAGSGITPIMSIARTLLETEPQSQFILIYGNKSPKETIFHEEILTLKRYMQSVLRCSLSTVKSMRMVPYLDVLTVE